MSVNGDPAVRCTAVGPATDLDDSCPRPPVIPSFRLHPVTARTSVHPTATTSTAKALRERSARGRQATSFTILRQYPVLARYDGAGTAVFGWTRTVPHVSAATYTDRDFFLTTAMRLRSTGD
jgi:hypothetical protein